MSSAITLADVAEYLTGADGNDGLGGWPGLHAEGNVVHITVKPVTETEPDGENNEVPPEVHFEAHVFKADPPAPMAAEPVKLPAELARELACCGPNGDPIDGWTVVANEEFDHSRWDSIHRLVIRNEQGEHFMDTYRQGLTERQDYGPYEDESTATFTPVAPTVKVVTEWKAAPRGGRS